MFVIPIQSERPARLVWVFVLIVSLSSAAAGQDVASVDFELLGHQAIRSGRYIESVQYFRLALERAERDRVSEKAMVTALGKLAAALRSARQFVEAEKVLDRALLILRGSSSDVRGDLMPMILTTQGWVYQETGRYGRSESVLKQALRLSERDLHPRHANVVLVLNSLGVLYTSMDKREQAERSLQRALALAEMGIGKDDFVLGSLLTNLAVLYAYHREWSRAEPLFVRALHLAETSLGEEHPKTATILGGLGLLYAGQQRFAEAEKVLRRTLEIRRKVLGLEDWTTATTSFHLAVVLAAQGNYDAAAKHYEASLRMHEQQLGSSHSDVAIVLEQLAKVLRALRRDAEASDVEARARLIREDANHVVTANDLRR